MRTAAFVIAACFATAACGDGSNVLLGDGRGAPLDASDGGGTDSSSGFDAGPDSSGACEPGQEVPEERLDVLDTATGFGAKATGGGRDACLYTVTSGADNGAGTLRDALLRPEPLWIVFDDSVSEVSLADDGGNVLATSNKTIDGRGSLVTIRNYGLQLGAGVSNVVVLNLTFTGNSELGGDTADAIGIHDGAHTVWIDHCDLWGYGDELIEVSQGATDVTISWSHFHDHEAGVLLLGDSADDPQMELRVTAHHNWYDATESYHPRLRFGIAHSYNNLIDSWTEWGSGAAMDGKLLSEANVFRPLDDFEATITSIGDDPAPGFVRSVNDVANGATIATNGEDQVPDPPYLYMVDPTDTLEAVLRAQTGPQPWP